MNKKLKQFATALLDVGANAIPKTIEIGFEDLYALFPDKLARFSNPKDRPLVCFARKYALITEIYVVGQREVLVCGNLNMMLPKITRTFVIDQLMTVSTRMNIVDLASGGTPIISCLFQDQAQVQKFIACLMEAKNSQNTPSQSPAARSTAERLQELETLKGMLSPEEYQQKRDKILRSL